MTTWTSRRRRRSQDHWHEYPLPLWLDVVGATCWGLGAVMYGCIAAFTLGLVGMMLDGPLESLGRSLMAATWVLPCFAGLALVVLLGIRDIGTSQALLGHAAAGADQQRLPHIEQMRRSTTTPFQALF